MKNFAGLLSVCLILSVKIQKFSCQELMVFARENKVYSRVLDEDADSKYLTQFNQDVTGLIIHNGYLYVLKKKYTIWRVKVSAKSQNFKIDDSSWEEYYGLNNVEADLLSMTIANGYIYVGCGDASIWRCSIDDPSWCDDLHVPKGFFQEPLISEIDFNPDDRLIYAIRSNPIAGTKNWNHHLVQCSPNIDGSCVLGWVSLKDWPTLHVAFDAMWISAGGVILKCPFKKNRNSNDKLDCFQFQNFNRSAYTNVGSSSKYLYVRFESRYREHNLLWRCNPKKWNSCAKTEELLSRKMGPFLFVSGKKN